jgi:hypothetical protein
MFRPWIRKRVEENGPGLNKGPITAFALVQWEQPSQNSRYSSRDSNRDIPNATYKCFTRPLVYVCKAA